MWTWCLVVIISSVHIISTAYDFDDLGHASFLDNCNSNIRGCSMVSISLSRPPELVVSVIAQLTSITIHGIS